MQLNRQKYLELLTEGKAAFTGGDPFDACPYNQYGNAEEQFGARYWRRGWVEARTEAEDQEPAPASTTGQ